MFLRRSSLGTSNSVFASSLRDGVTFPGRACLSPRSEQRLFLHLPGVWLESSRWGHPVRSILSQISIGTKTLCSPSLVVGAKPSRWGHPFRVVWRFSAHSIGTKASSVHLSFVASRWGLLTRLVRRGRTARVRLPFPLPPEAPAAPEVKAKEPERCRPPDGTTLPVRVGGFLAPHWRWWQAIGSEPWVVTVLRDGYRVPFLDSPPPLSCTPVSFLTYRAGSPRAQEVEAMLAKGALEIARDPGPGFYSRLFLVEKASGGWRPVIDLSHLNEFVQLTRFKMETVASVLLSVREGDFLASLDLKDSCFQIPIHPSSRKLLRFTLEGTVYQFRALCFGLSTAPQVFTRVFAAVSAWAHSHGIRLLRYLDDWLILSSSEWEAKQ